MPNWIQIVGELKEGKLTHDEVRKKYISALFNKTGRNVISYYSGWLQKPKLAEARITDADKNGFMAVIHKLDRSKGLDLVLHTPGGGTAATESIVDYLLSMFDSDIRVIVPQLAMSAGTLIACSAREIIMGKQSSLGPIDPQLPGGIAAHALKEEFETAFEEIKADPVKTTVWQPILQKYQPTLIGECEKALVWSESLAKDWLKLGMFKDDEDADEKIATILMELGDHSVNLNHARHISMAKAKQIGLNVTAMEDDDELQDLILSVHHATILTLTMTNVFKVIENHTGAAYMQAANVVVKK